LRGDRSDSRERGLIARCLETAGNWLLATTWRTLGLVAGLLVVSSAAAADCAPKASVELPIKFVSDLPVTSLTIRNEPVSFILDTGAERTIIAPALAKRLHLRQHRAYPRQLRGLGSAVTGSDVELPGLAAAGVALPNFGALVGTDLPPIAGMIPDGLLGADILSRFDVDLDLAHDYVRLYDNPACSPAQVWHQPYTAIAANRSLHDRLFFRALLDGRPIAVVFDTGARHSVLDIRAARVTAGVGRTVDVGPAVALHGLAGSVEGHMYHFRQLLLAGVQVSDPALVVAPLDLDDADLLLGADFLRTRRVWLSYRSHRIFLGNRPERGF
jgi:predicted aspartyl protease